MEELFVLCLTVLWIFMWCMLHGFIVDDAVDIHLISFFFQTFLEANIYKYTFNFKKNTLTYL